MNTRKTKLRYVEITDRKMQVFLSTTQYPRQYWAIRKIEDDQDKTLDYIKFLEDEMDTTYDNFELSRLIANRNIAEREFFAQRRCLQAIKDYHSKLTGIYS